MSYVQSGDEQAAGLAKSIVDNLEAGNTEAVANLADTLAQVDSQQQAAASATADWVENFSGQMNDLVAEMKETLDCSDESRAAAEAVIDGYASTILSRGNYAREDKHLYMLSPIPHALENVTVEANGQLYKVTVDRDHGNEIFTGIYVYYLTWIQPFDPEKEDTYAD